MTPLLTLLPFAMLLTTAGAGALLRGGPVERRGVALFAIGWLASLTVQLAPGQILQGLLLAVIDMAVMVSLIALTWKSPRPWPAAACGFQALALAAGVAKWLQPDLDTHIYLGLLAAAGYGAVGALAVGAWLQPVPLKK